MQNYARIGGVLSIVSGAFGVLWLLFFIFIGVIIGLAVTYGDSSTEDAAVRNIMIAIYGFVGLCYALLGALGIVGGIFSLKRKYWGWSLAGAIAGAITMFPCGIPAIIFVTLGKGEFEGQRAPARAVEEVDRQGGI
jgi:hypothetical protein